MKQSRRKLIAVIGGAVILIVIIAIVLLHTPAANRYALGILQDLLRRDFGIELKASRVRYNALRLSVSLDQVALGATAAPDLPPFLQVERADFRLSLPRLLAGIPAISAARLDGVKVHYLLTEDGRSNIPRDPKAKPFEELPDFLIAELEAPAGSLLFEDRQSQLKIEIPRWKLGVNGNPVTLAHRLVFEAEQAGTANYQGHALPVEKVELTATLKKKDLALEKLHLRLGNSEISGSGSLEDFARPSLNFNIEPNLDLSQLAELAEIGVKTGRKSPRQDFGYRAPRRHSDLRGYRRRRNRRGRLHADRLQRSSALEQQGRTAPAGRFFRPVSERASGRKGRAGLESNRRQPSRRSNSRPRSGTCDPAFRAAGPGVEPRQCERPGAMERTRLLQPVGGFTIQPGSGSLDARTQRPAACGDRIVEVGKRPNRSFD